MNLMPYFSLSLLLVLIGFYSPVLVPVILRPRCCLVPSFLALILDARLSVYVCVYVCLSYEHNLTCSISLCHFTHIHLLLPLLTSLMSPLTAACRVSP